MNRRTYSLPRRVMNPLAFLAEVREKPLADKLAEFKARLELEARVIDET